MPPSIPPDASVCLRGINRSFDEGGRLHRVLADINIDVRQGESLALRGRSGSGKSTLLNLVCGIDTPDSGEILVAGRNITALPERDRTLFRRRHVGFVYQAFNLLPTLSVADNIRFVLELNGVEGAECGRRVLELLHAVGLEERAGSFPERLSGGEQQRVAIARALVHRPTLLLADEPTGNLDDRSAGNVLGLIFRLREEQGATLILATHSASVAGRCDRVVELRAGSLVEEG